MEPVGREMDGTLYRIYRAGGREFAVYYVYYEDVGYCEPQYPDFEEQPEYDEEGRPFTLAVQEGCIFAQPDVPDEPFGGDCGSCRFFLRQERTDLFGLCLCPERRELEQA